MSTLPFLLSVADELDNINSQSYMDDFGLGFHPHRQYYRTPTIQLSLPASTDWMQERQRCRTHKFVDETQNNLQSTAEADENVDDGEGGAGAGEDTACALDKYGDRYGGASTSAAGSRQKYTSALNSNNDNDDEDKLNNVDKSVKIYNLSKKCCKNYHRHGKETSGKCTTKSGEGSGGFKLHSKCLEGNNSSSEESLQKVSSSIEFLTCFLMKKSRASKNSTGVEGSGKKS
ncbi:uncharacterized protein LOC119672456 [Teleopsis dalmanni]|uniref:uncharacterized protein LOC119672456 n=1 Tax=Teleopsis dalmanni TaxID=139649 RepID=UPI0018CED3A5|nr:uncharacterized protein LOC119672456 [Teleopsis dalmanni]